VSADPWEANHGFLHGSTLRSPYSEPRTLYSFFTFNCCGGPPLLSESLRINLSSSIFYILSTSCQLCLSALSGSLSIPLCRLARIGSRPFLVCSFAAMNQEEHSSASTSESQFPNAALQISDPAGQASASPSRSTVPPRKRAPLASVACQDCRRRKTKVGPNSARLLGMCSY
jgi:hypothetical protein